MHRIINVKEVILINSDIGEFKNCQII